MLPSWKIFLSSHNRIRGIHPRVIPRRAAGDGRLALARQPVEPEHRHLTAPEVHAGSRTAAPIPVADDVRLTLAPALVGALAGDFGGDHLVGGAVGVVPLRAAGED